MDGKRVKWPDLFFPLRYESHGVLLYQPYTRLTETLPFSDLHKGRGVSAECHHFLSMPDYQVVEILIAFYSGAWFDSTDSHPRFFILALHHSQSQSITFIIRCCKVILLTSLPLCIYTRMSVDFLGGPFPAIGIDFGFKYAPPTCEALGLSSPNSATLV